MIPRFRLGILAFIIHVCSPLVFIWSINTLFNVGIPFSFKTWLAGIVLIYVVRYHIRPNDTYRSRYFEDEYDDEEPDDDDEEDKYVRSGKDKYKEDYFRIFPEKLKTHEEEHPDDGKKDGKAGKRKE